MNEKLTGRTRWRAESAFLSKEPRVVLQVEIGRSDGPDDYHGMPTYLAGTYWRDVNVADLVEINVAVKD